MGIPDAEVYNYGTELRRLAAVKCTHISFARLNRLVLDDCPEAANVDEYVQNASWYRNEMVKKYLPTGFNVRVELKTNINALMTYRGYLKFLQTDLRYEKSRQRQSGKQVKKMNEAVAKLMIARGAVRACLSS